MLQLVDLRTAVEPSAADRSGGTRGTGRRFVRRVQPFGRLARRERFDGVGGDAFPERGGEGVHGFPEHLSRIRSLEGDDRQRPHGARTGGRPHDQLGELLVRWRGDGDGADSRSVAGADVVVGGRLPEPQARVAFALGPVRDLHPDRTRTILGGGRRGGLSERIDDLRQPARKGCPEVRRCRLSARRKRDGGPTWPPCRPTGRGSISPGACTTSASTSCRHTSRTSTSRRRLRLRHPRRGEQPRRENLRARYAFGCTPSLPCLPQHRSYG